MSAEEVRRILNENGWKGTLEELFLAAGAEDWNKLNSPDEAGWDDSGLQTGARTNSDINTQETRGHHNLSTIPFTEWCIPNSRTHILIPDSFVPGFLMTRLPLSVSDQGLNHDLTRFRRTLLDRYLLLYDAGIRNTGIWACLVPPEEADPIQGRFLIQSTGEWSNIILGASRLFLDSDLEATHHIRAQATPSRDRSSLDFLEPREDENDPIRDHQQRILDEFIGQLLRPGGTVFTNSHQPEHSWVMYEHP